MLTVLVDGTIPKLHVVIVNERVVEHNGRPFEHATDVVIADDQDGAFVVQSGAGQKLATVRAVR